MGGALRECLVAGALCNDASLRSEHGRWLITGDPTEAALLVAARKGGLDEHTLRALLPRFDELPFDACRQFMATAHAGDGDPVLYVKGALERLLPLLHRSTSRGWPDRAARPHVPSRTPRRAYAEQGLRVLLLARRAQTVNARSGGGDRGWPDADRPGRHDRPATQGGHRCHPQLPFGRRTGQDDYRRSRRSPRWPLPGRSAWPLTARSPAANWPGSTIRRWPKRPSASMSLPASNRSRSCAWCAPCRVGARWWR